MMERYTRPGKNSAYQTALQVAQNLSDAQLWMPNIGFTRVITATRNKHPHISPNDLRDIAAKALRTERGKRR